MNLASVIVLAVVTAAVVLALVRTIRHRGKSCGCGDCSGCTGCPGCHIEK